MPRDDPSPPPDPFDRRFPTLPILSPDDVRRPDRERYGALFYLGIAGLVVLVGLLGWFGWGVWSNRSVWSNVYALHDARRPEPERVRAAFELAHDPRVNQRQLWDMAMSRSLPPLARYALAEALTAEAAEADPRGYGQAVVRSEGWPVWLRLLLVRPLAYRAALDLPVPTDSLALLAQSGDRGTALWAAYALGEGPRGDPASVEALRRAATGEAPERPLARLLLDALESNRLDDRLKALEEATAWLREHHPDAARLWDGWKVEDGRPVRTH
jgi:hypothetical protein